MIGTDQGVTAEDIVTRLRKQADRIGLLLTDPPQETVDGALMREAAAQIASLKERLESAEEENARLRKDRDRLDFLDRCNQRLNATYGTNYGWQLILNRNVNRLMLGHMDIDLHDSHGGKGKLSSCRGAIDAEMDRIAAAKPTPALQEQEKQNG